MNESFQDVLTELEEYLKEKLGDNLPFGLRDLLVKLDNTHIDELDQEYANGYTDGIGRGYSECEQEYADGLEQ